MRRFFRRFTRRLLNELDDFLYATRPQCERILGIFLLFVGALALFALVTEYGGYELSSRQRRLDHILDLVVVWGFALNTLAHLAIAPNRRAFLRGRWFEFVLLGVLVSGYVMALPVWGLQPVQDVFAYFLGRVESTRSPVARFYIEVTMGYILLSLLISGARYSHHLFQARFRPLSAVVVSFLFVISVGTGLLMLPSATVKPGTMPFVDALFTAVSAVCVTGLIVVDTATYFTWFGQSVILALIQIGGLGYMTLTAFFVLFFGSGAGLRERAYVRDVLDDASVAAARASLRRMVLFTATIELIGTLIFYASIPDEVILNRPRWFVALFHAVSAFCNAGFDLFGDSFSSEALRFSLPININAIMLIVLGGLGFSVLTEVAAVPKRILNRLLRRRGRRVRFSVQSRLVLLISGLLIVTGTVGYLLLEQEGTLRGLSAGERLLGALFQSVTTRTAGFNTLDTTAIRIPTALMMMFLMVIGASPGGTGGGVKTTTIGVAMLSAIATARGRRKIEIFHRHIPDEAVYRALSVLAFAFVVILTSIFFLTLTEADSGAPLIAILFEEASAFATVGLSMGLTGLLSTGGKFVIMISMFLGRVGPLTLAIALSQRVDPGKYDYPTEHVIVT